jgi:formylglycine-generating enzyme required for sulfatase activity
VKVDVQVGVRAQSGALERPMVWIPPATFRMGSERYYPEEKPIRRARIEGFWIDRAPVTNRDFLVFVEATGHATLAERAPDPAAYPGAASELLQPGSAVFTRPEKPADTLDWRSWWRYEPGADWRHPEGPGSSISERWDHPVVHVAYADAEAYAAWCGKALPTEAEWECAARGALDGREFAWGDTLTPGGRHMANTWQGQFPSENTRADGYEGTSPVGAFPANGYGLFDMIGNVWEWTADDYRFPPRAAGGCCAGGNADGGEVRKVLKGGSFLCAPSYCQRYRPAARSPETVDTSTSHIGFRCVRRQREAAAGGSATAP